MWFHIWPEVMIRTKHWNTQKHSTNNPSVCRNRSMPTSPQQQLLTEGIGGEVTEQNRNIGDCHQRMSPYLPMCPWWWTANIGRYWCLAVTWITHTPCTCYHYPSGWFSFCFNTSNKPGTYSPVRAGFTFLKLNLNPSIYYNVDLFRTHLYLLLDLSL